MIRRPRRPGAPARRRRASSAVAGVMVAAALIIPSAAKPASDRPARVAVSAVEIRGGARDGRVLLVVNASHRRSAERRSGRVSIALSDGQGRRLARVSHRAGVRAREGSARRHRIGHRILLGPLASRRLASANTVRSRVSVDGGPPVALASALAVPTSHAAAGWADVVHAYCAPGGCTQAELAIAPGSATRPPAVQQFLWRIRSADAFEWDPLSPPMSLTCAASGCTAGAQGTWQGGRGIAQTALQVRIAPDGKSATAGWPAGANRPPGTGVALTAR